MSPIFKEMAWLSIFLTLVCCLVIIESEIVIRSFRLMPDKMIGLDSCMGFKSLPNKHGYIPGPQRPILVQNNSIGFRDVEHAIEKKPGTFRILFLGDSVTEATQVPLEETFWRQLQALADARGMAIEVFSFGTGSFGTAQELVAYTCYGRQYRPDLVVLGFMANDVADNYSRTDPFIPKFSLSEGALVLDESYRARVQERMDQYSTFFPGTLYWVRDNSFFVRYLIAQFENARAAELFATTGGGVDGGAPIFLKEYPTELESAWLLTEAIIKYLAEEVRVDGGKFAIMHIPSLEQFDHRHLSDPEKYDFSKASTRLADIAQQLRVPFLDLYLVIASAEEEGGRWPNDAHLTKHGHKVVAEKLLMELDRFGGPSLMQ